MDGIHLYERGREAVIYATFTTVRGEAATVVGTPTISMFHYKANSYITDVNAEDMTLMNGTTYYYKHSFPPNADLGQYVARFSATYDTGETVLGEQDIRLVERDFYKDVGRAVGGIVKPAGAKAKEVWSSKEKTGLLQLIADIRRKLDKLSIPAPSAPIQKQFETKELESRIAQLTQKIEEKEMPKDRSDELLASLADLRSSLTKSQEIAQDVSLLKESNERLMELVLKTLPATELDAILTENNDDHYDKTQGTNIKGSQ